MTQGKGPAGFEVAGNGGSAGPGCGGGVLAHF